MADFGSNEDDPSVFERKSQVIINFLNNQDIVTNHIHQHQADATLRVYEHFRNHPEEKNALVVLPTGAGKTGVAVLCSYALAAHRVLVITPTEEISKQICKAFVGYDRKPSFLYERKIAGANVRSTTILPSYRMISNTREEIGNQQLIIVNAQRITNRSRMQVEDLDANLFDLVIIDEAHHHPASMWKTIVDHFANAKKLFITATPKRGDGSNILANQRVVYELTVNQAIERGIIRALNFIEVDPVGADANPDADAENKDNPHNAADMEEDDGEVKAPNSDEDTYASIADRIHQALNEHDQMQPNVKHQAMVILQNQIKATTFAAIYNARVALPKDKCYSFITNSNRSVLTKFIQLKFRTLVIVQRLKEGFDHPNISVVGIARHVSSPVMFTQFVGRAVRKPRDDGVGAVVITHSYFNQSRNFERLTSLRRDDENDAVDDQEEKVDDE